MRLRASAAVRVVAVASMLSTIGSAVLVAVAEAACNAIPSADRQDPDPTLLSLNTSAEVTLAQFGYKGALGRIDRVYLLPSSGSPGRTRAGTATAVVVPDGICVGEDGRPTSPPPGPLLPSADLVVLTYFHSADGKRAVASPSASAETCKAFTKAMSEQMPATRSKLARGCSPVDPEPIVIKGLQGLRIPLPNAAEVQQELGSAVSPAIRVVVAPRDGAIALLANPMNQSCSAMCPALVNAHAVACLDTVYALSIGPGGQAVYTPDPVPCSVQMPTTVAANDFAKACENSDGTAPACMPDNPLPDLALWQDDCGGVHVPFLWTGIRPAASAPIRTRLVMGRSGVGRKKPDDNPAVWVPGREFVGSTPIADPQGTSPGISWRKPYIDVWRDVEGAQEVGLRGTVDQDDSIVHVFPRLRTKLVCAGTNQSNACMGVTQDSSGGLVTCACTDLGQPGCTCEEAGTARYFVCSGGASSGMPCTRDNHCYPNGFCNGKPHCQKPGEVWTGQPDNSGTECTVDDDCKTESQKKQCGYELFNLDDAVDNGTLGPSGHKIGKIVLDGKITGAGARKRRGACHGNGASGDACGNGNGPNACPRGDCRGYQLKAGPLQ